MASGKKVIFSLGSGPHHKKIVDPNLHKMNADPKNDDFTQNTNYGTYRFWQYRTLPIGPAFR